MTLEYMRAKAAPTYYSFTKTKTTCYKREKSVGSKTTTTKAKKLIGKQGFYFILIAEDHTEMQFYRAAMNKTSWKMRQ